MKCEADFEYPIDELFGNIQNTDKKWNIFLHYKKPAELIPPTFYVYFLWGS